ncbi:surfeit locus 1 family protein [Hoeflea marina]|uniref:SURF1-like protein n=1 Tax=Hoeflea marina TaxID=274592 RepID=A0A317PM92_9HYPH|nr:SURF1 family protein [Hoeflea marina]PWW01877.1 surfeit locus 1 family protein [Hoeflea marina]
MADRVVRTGPRRPGPVAVIVVLALFGVLVTLGTWQVQRLAWKEGLLATIAERMAAGPVPLDDVIAIREEGGDIEYRPTRVKGRFLHEREQFFFATLDGATGYHVYTPLERADGSVIFVNRGFVGVDSKDPASRQDGEMEGEVTVTGLARNRLDGRPSMMVPDNDPAKNIFFWKDLDAMAKNAGIDRSDGKLIDFFVDADATPNPGGLPVGGVTIINMPNSHLQYAVTWYGLALALLAVSAVVLFRKPGVPDAD